MEKNNQNIKLIKENENGIQIIVRIYFIDHEKSKQNSINSKRKREKNRDLISFDQLFDCNGNIFRTIR